MLFRSAEVLQRTRFTSKQHFEERFSHRLRATPFQPGDLVLVRNTAIEKEMNRKHKPRYLGPYEVVRQTQNSSYVVKELNGDISRESIAAFRLLAYDPTGRTLQDLVSDPISAIGESRTAAGTSEVEELEDLIAMDDDDLDILNLQNQSDEDQDDLPIGMRTRSQRR